MSKLSEVEKEMTSIREDSLKKQVVRKTPIELAQILATEGKFELTSSEMLVLSNMDLTDFLEAVAITDLSKRLQVLGKIFSRFSLEISLEGSVALGEFNIGDHSWNLSAGASGSMVIKARPILLRKSVNDLVSFLNMLPVGQGFVLKPSQDLLLEGLTSDSMLDYYKLCQENEDAAARERGQDELFAKNCQTLSLKGLVLKIYGVNAKQVDRGIDVNAGGILFRAMAAEGAQAASLVVVLLNKEPKA